MGAAFVAGVTAVSSTFAFMGNEEVQNAITANDYTAFVEVAGDRVLKKIDSEEAFAEFATKHQEMQAAREEMQVGVLAAVKANDLQAFQAIHDEKKSKMEAAHDEKDNGEGRVRPEPTAEQLAEMKVKQAEHFTELITYYNENWELPEQWMSKWFGARGHGKWHGKRGGDCVTK